MTTDLHARAADQEALHRAAAADITQALAAARDELARRHTTPGSVARSDWGTALGAVEHRELAVAALDEVRAQQVAVRAAIAAIANPADADTHETQLRTLMVDEADLRVQLRHAKERVAAGEAEVAALATLAARAEAELAAAADRTAWGEEHHERGDDLRDALTAPPLDTIVADANAVSGGAEMAAANDRLDELVPTELRTRAEERAGEAQVVLDRARENLARIADHAATLDTAEAPLQAGERIGAAEA
ncbi:MAG: hypothetical protein JJE52_16405, partial [Acidimicrobiia bacterium]|nr:hypothetical protein [Acidimicrobiia bacterium]